MFDCELWLLCPTVEMFGSQDVDSSLLPQELATMGEWEERASLQVHVMQDRSFHSTTILAGLWGANN